MGERVPYQFQIIQDAVECIRSRAKGNVSIWICGEANMDEIVSCDRFQSAFIFSENVVEIFFYVLPGRYGSYFRLTFV